MSGIVTSRITSDGAFAKRWRNAARPLSASSTVYPARSSSSRRSRRMSSSSSTTNTRGRVFMLVSYHPADGIPLSRADPADMARVLISEPHDDISALLELVVRRLGHEPVRASEAADYVGIDAAVIEPGELEGLRLARALRAQ